MTNSLVFLTVLLLMSGSVLDYINPYRGDPQPWTDPDCADVAWCFLPCMNFLEGFEPDPAPACCGQLGKLNTIAGRKDGPQRICKCVTLLTWWRRSVPYSNHTMKHFRACAEFIVVFLFTWAALAVINRNDGCEFCTGDVEQNK